MNDSKKPSAEANSARDAKAAAFWADDGGRERRVEPTIADRATGEKPASLAGEAPTSPPPETAASLTPDAQARLLQTADLSREERAAIASGKANEARQPRTKPAAGAAVETGVDSRGAVRREPVETEPKRQRKTRAKPAGRARAASSGPRLSLLRRIWNALRRSFYLLASLLFLAAAGVVGYFAGEPWISAWLDDSAPDITIPSAATIRAMPPAERDALAGDALRVVRHNPQRVINESLPTTIDSRPLEVGTFPLKSRNRLVSVSGVARRFRLPDNREFLRLTDFEISPGYELVLALSPDPDPRDGAALRDSGYLEFAQLKAEVGAQNFLLPDTFSIEDFDSLVIFDRLFGTLYASARLR